MTAIAEWLDAVAAQAWVEEQFARAGLRRTGAIEWSHTRPWSVVWRIPTADGPVWFKANGGATGYEAGLAGALARWVPGRVLAPLAVDARRGWQLTPDGGVTLRRHEPGKDVRVWEALVGQYAQLQRDLHGRMDEMLTLGVPDCRPQTLTTRVAAMIEDPAAGLSAGSRDRLRALLPEYEQWCARLADSRVAASLNHDDLHDANVLVRAPGARHVFFDWGDASVAFPFTTLLVTLRSFAARFALPADDPAVLRVRDAYLEAYGSVDLDAARELARLATWTGKPARAASWQRALVGAEPAAVAEYGDAVAGWLEELLEPGPL